MYRIKIKYTSCLNFSSSIHRLIIIRCRFFTMKHCIQPMPSQSMYCNRELSYSYYNNNNEVEIYTACYHQRPLARSMCWLLSRRKGKSFQVFLKNKIRMKQCLWVNLVESFMLMVQCRWTNILRRLSDWTLRHAVVHDQQSNDVATQNFCDRRVKIRQVLWCHAVWLLYLILQCTVFYTAASTVVALFLQNAIQVFICKT